jgi:hypothetical protein
VADTPAFIHWQAEGGRNFAKWNVSHISFPSPGTGGTCQSASLGVIGQSGSPQCLTKFDLRRR